MSFLERVKAIVSEGPEVLRGLRDDFNKTKQFCENPAYKELTDQYPESDLSTATCGLNWEACDRFLELDKETRYRVVAAMLEIAKTNRWNKEVNNKSADIFQLLRTSQRRVTAALCSNSLETSHLTSYLETITRLELLRSGSSDKESLEAELDCAFKELCLADPNISRSAETINVNEWILPAE